MPVILSQNFKVPKATTLPNVVSLVNKTGFKLASRLGYLIVALDFVILVRQPGGFVRVELIFQTAGENHVARCMGSCLKCCAHFCKSNEMQKKCAKERVKVYHLLQNNWIKL